MKAVSQNQLHDFLHSLTTEYNVFGPVALHDGTLSLGQLEQEPFKLLSGKIPLRITSIFFPHISRLLTISNDQIDVPETDSKPILIIGLTAEDLETLEFTDMVFLTGCRDDLYHKSRSSSIIIGVSGRRFTNGEFSRISGGKCDIELINDGERFIISPYSEKGKTLSDRIDMKDDTVSIKALQQESDALLEPDRDILQKASELLLQDKVSDEFWINMANQCIECTTCNNVCPTCTCFDMYDISQKDKVTRYRQWDSCLLSGFMREASGHNPLGDQASRARRRIHHKLAADVNRWGRISCFLCGRCDDICPTGLGMKAVARDIVKQFG